METNINSTTLFCAFLLLAKTVFNLLHSRINVANTATTECKGFIFPLKTWRDK